MSHKKDGKAHGAIMKNKKEFTFGNNIFVAYITDENDICMYVKVDGYTEKIRVYQRHIVISRGNYLAKNVNVVSSTDNSITIAVRGGKHKVTVSVDKTEHRTAVTTKTSYNHGDTIMDRFAVYGNGKLHITTVYTDDTNTSVENTDVDLKNKED